MRTVLWIRIQWIRNYRVSWIRNQICNSVIMDPNPYYLSKFQEISERKCITLKYLMIHYLSLFDNTFFSIATKCPGGIRIRN
jgi:hypothetical protein